MSVKEDTNNIKNPNNTESEQRSLNFSEQTIEETAKSDLTDSLDLNKEKIKKQLEAAKNVEQRIKLFTKWSDEYGLEAIAGMIPAIGDLTPAVVSSCYLLIEGARIGLHRKDCLKILGYQTIDVIFGSIPVIGDVVDFFFKGNKYSAKVFNKHIEKLKKAAIEKGISQEEIDNMGNKEAKFLKAINKYTNYKPKKT